MEAVMESPSIQQGSRTRLGAGTLVLQNFVKSFVDLVYPPSCAACNKPLPRIAMDSSVCLSCWSQIKMNRPPFCHACGRQMSRKDFSKNMCGRCARTPMAFDRAYSVCVYDGPIKTLIQAFKYKDKQHLGKVLSKLPIDFIKEYAIPIQYMDYLVPIPLHSVKLREREFNQADILCREIGAAFGKTVLYNNLFRYRATNAQATLEPHQRFLNVRGSFAVTEKESLRGKNIMLIDDVLTTGATASDAARSLKDAGANIVFVLTLAS
jgi:ComF family protein